MQSHHAMFETLEPRNLMAGITANAGVVSVTGSSGVDKISIRQIKDVARIALEVPGAAPLVKRVPITGLSRIVVDGGGGRDVLAVDAVLDPNVVDRHVETRRIWQPDTGELVDAATAPVVGEFQSSFAAWNKRFNAQRKAAAGKHPDIIFLGDSMIERFATNGAEAFAKYYGSRNTLNLGIIGDTTAQVIYRLQHEILAGMSPKVAVLEVGTNNVTRTSNDLSILRGISAVISLLRQQVPEIRIALCGLMPRLDKVDNATVNRVNQVLVGMARKNVIRYIEPVTPMGTAYFRTDHIHMNAAGYMIWAALIEPAMEKMLV